MLLRDIIDKAFGIKDRIDLDAIHDKKPIFEEDIRDFSKKEASERFNIPLKNIIVIEVNPSFGGSSETDWEDTLETFTSTYVGGVLGFLIQEDSYAWYKCSPTELSWYFCIRLYDREEALVILSLSKHPQPDKEFLWEIVIEDKKFTKFLSALRHLQLKLEQIKAAAINQYKI